MGLHRRPNQDGPWYADAMKLIHSLPRVAGSFRLLAVFLFVGATVGNALAQAAGSEPRTDDQTDVLTLTRFVDNLSQFSATFEQTVYDADNVPIQTTRGSVRLKRPGRFIWAVESPDPQQIVADGNKVWMYDEALQQATVSSLSDRAGGTPLALLMGDVPLAQAFTVRGLGVSDSLDWFELIPNDKESDFEAVYIALEGDSLGAMELRDNFGQATQIRFSNFDSDPQLSDTQFHFTPPDGVDVIGQIED